MKKIILTLVTLLSVSQFLHAQWTSGADIYNTNTGSVIIGATAPAAINASAALFPSVIPKFTVVTGQGSAPYSEVVTLRHPGVNSDAGQRQIGFALKLSSEGSSIESDKMGGMLLESGNPNGNLPSFSLLTANTRRLTIDYNGNIGIGTTTPGARLEIAGTASSPNLFLDNSQFSANRNPLTGAVVDATKGSATIVLSANINGGNMQFHTNAATGGAVAERMRITENGNVGIGTTDPKGYKLAVNGSVIATSMTVKLYNDWPDYVFKKDYQLPSLQEVKKYIDQNLHLPEIPSAQEIAKDGLNLGEMNKLLVKKVEELTLYLIEKDEIQKEQRELTEKQSTELKQQRKESEKRAQLQDERIRHLEERLNQLANSKN